MGLESSSSHHLHHLAGNSFTVYSVGTTKSVRPVCREACGAGWLSGLLWNPPMHGSRVVTALGCYSGAGLGISPSSALGTSRDCPAGSMSVEEIPCLLPLPVPWTGRYFLPLTLHGFCSRPRCVPSHPGPVDPDVKETRVDGVVSLPPEGPPESHPGHGHQHGPPWWPPSLTPGASWSLGDDSFPFKSGDPGSRAGQQLGSPGRPSTEPGSGHSIHVRGTEMQ